MSRSTLSETLVELVTALAPRAPAGLVRLTDVAFDVPIEVAVSTDAAGTPVLLANPRRWRMVTVFDSDPGRLRLRMQPHDGEVGHA